MSATTALLPCRGLEVLRRADLGASAAAPRDGTEVGVDQAVGCGLAAAPCREPGLVRRRTCREMRTRPRCGAHPDGRLRDRVVEMGRAWEHAPGASPPVISPGAVERKVRLLSNDRITMEHILERHQEAAVLTAAGWNRRVLATQYTTTLKYNGHEKGLVNLGGVGKGTRGLLAHVGLAVTEVRSGCSSSTRRQGG